LPAVTPERATDFFGLKPEAVLLLLMIWLLAVLGAEMSVPTFRGPPG
jgi:hypothetical protein